MGDKVVLCAMGMDSSKYGGIERFNVALSRSLSERGYKGVFIYETAPSSQDFVDDIDAANGEIVVLNSRKKPLEFCVELVKLIKKYRPIIVHSHFTKARFYVIPVAYFMGIRKLFFTVHGKMPPKKSAKPFTRLWYDWASKVAKVIGVSDDIAVAYKSNWPDAEVKRIYLGVKRIQGERGECRCQLGIPQNQLVLLSVSNFNHIKGLDVLCKALKVLKERRGLNENTCLYIVGQPTKDIEELKILVEELGIQKYIQMKGISNQVPSYMLSADIYIQSSRSEGLPLAIMEATSAMLPVVATKVGGNPEIVKDGYNGILVDSENAVMLADAIGRLILDKELRKEYGENSLKVFSEEFSIDKGVDHVIQYYGI